MIGRIMAVDFGSKRIGIAFSDPLGMFATPHSVIENTGLDSVCIALTKLAQGNSVTQIVIGIPYAIDGSHTPKTTETMEFIEAIKMAFNIPVQGWDERYSSSEAEIELKKMGKSWQEARKMVDAMAAAMILKSYLESLNN